ncbi:hypothetical protein WME76_23995 [Sorangium sp. So ce119]|uniref:hypothetical protein n=1 Tax=Sorangium sp. So ce119 TaxID=3133279 RepID=UPI003F6281E6
MHGRTSPSPLLLAAPLAILLACSGQENGNAASSGSGTASASTAGGGGGHAGGGGGGGGHAGDVAHGRDIGAANTGIAGAVAAGLPCGQLTDYDGPRIVDVPGTVIENKRIVGAIKILADDVTVRCCDVDLDGAVDARGIWVGYETNPSGWRIEWNTIHGGTTGTIGIDLTTSGDGVCRRNDVSEQENGMRLSGGHVEENYLHDPIPYDGTAHRDQIEIYGTSQPTSLLRNRIEHDGEETAAINITCDFGATDDVLVQDNFIDGGNYTLYNREQGHGMPTRVRFIGNQHGDSFYYGLISADREGTPDPEVQAADPERFLWQNNTWAETTDPAHPEGQMIPVP